jgi:hypothetical protein
LLGDLTESDMMDEMQDVYDLILQCPVPIYVLIGDHDQDYINLYLKYFRVLEFSFDYGPDNHFVALDTGWEWDQLDQSSIQFLAGDLASHKDVPNIFIACHAPPFFIAPGDNFELNRPAFKALCLQYGVKGVFFGHQHADGVSNIDGQSLALNASYTGPKCIMTSDCRDTGAYRVVTIDNGQILNYTIATGISARSNYVSDNASNLRITYSDPNDWSLGTVHATLTNTHLFEPFNLTISFNVISDTRLPTITSNGTWVVQSILPLVGNPSACTVNVLLEAAASSSYAIAVDGN